MKNYKCSLCKSDFKLISMRNDYWGGYDLCECNCRNSIYIYENMIQYHIDNDKYILSSSNEEFDEQKQITTELCCNGGYKKLFEFDGLFELVIKNNFICVNETIEKVLDLSVLK